MKSRFRSSCFSLRLCASVVKWFVQLKQALTSAIARLTADTFLPRA